MSPALVAWMLAAMTAWGPPRPNDAIRYDATARDLLSVAFDPAEEPLFEHEHEHEHEDGRARTALLLASFAAAESGGFLADVDIGKRRGAGGAVCIMQVKVARGGTEEGWSVQELLSSRPRCIRVGLHRLRRSMDACRALRGGDRLGAYTHGRCVVNNRIARFRLARAEAWLSAHPMPTD